MEDAEFKRLFLRTVGNVDNPFHPLVWINGSPQVGLGTYIGGFSEVNAKGAQVTIGRDCDIASFVAINVADSHRRCIGISDENHCVDIEIGDCVFIGSHSVILGGACIGHHCVVGAGTVITACIIPPFSLVVGNPMKIKVAYYQSEYEAKNGRYQQDSP